MQPELRGQGFNFSNETPITVLELVDKIIALMGTPLEPEVQNLATNEIRHQYLSAAKARQVLGWEPIFPLEAGLKKTIDWYRDFFTHEQAR